MYDIGVSNPIQLFIKLFSSPASIDTSGINESAFVIDGLIFNFKYVIVFAFLFFTILTWAYYFHQLKKR